ncbi:MAG: hypothetical protein P1U56_17185 [Saprospiraceae bacterium]|nr:hypothetical protein [Saprospiraceae bacterium]
MDINNMDIHTFIQTIFTLYYEGTEAKNRIVLYQEWQCNLHKEVHFIEVFEQSTGQWKIRHTIWDLAKDSFRLIDVMEKLKWVGKEILPTVIETEIVLPPGEKELLVLNIDKIEFIANPSYLTGDLKMMKFELTKPSFEIRWNKDEELEDVFKNIVRLLKANFENI